EQDTTIAGPDPVVVDFSLMPEVFTLSGTVTAGPAGTIPISGATIAISGPVNDQMTTDPQGSYSFSDLPAGDYEVTASANDFQSESRDVTVSATGPNVANFALLPAVYSVTGVVTEEGTETPISGATVVLDGPVTENVTTDALGAFTLSDVPSGMYTLTVSSAGYITNAQQISVDGSSVVRDVSLTPLQMTGTVTSSDGTELVGVSMTLTGPLQASTTTDPQGQYSFSHVLPGNYVLEASVSGYRSQSVNIFVSSGSSIVRNVVLKTVTTVSGLVTDQFKDVIVGATVELSGPDNRQTTTNANGGYTFTDVVEGDYTIDVSQSGYVPESKETTVAGSPVVVDFELIAGTNVVGQVNIVESSTPIAGATITLDGAGGTFVAASGIDGRFGFGVIPQGLYTATATAPNYAPDSYSTTLTGPADTLYFGLSPIVTSITGSVDDAQTSGVLEGVTVTVSGPTLAFDVTNSDGVYFIGSLPYGEYEFTASFSGYITYRDTIMLGSGGLEKDVYLSEELGGEVLRIVLTWNELPKDMDLHYWIYDADSIVPVNWFDRLIDSTRTLSEFPFALLDIDDTLGSGPETITVAQFVGDSAKILVENYGHRLGGEPTLTTQSGAHLDVYTSTKLIQLDVPTSGSGDWWLAFDLDEDGSISIVNQLEDLSGQSPPAPNSKQGAPLR
ncbi:MAG: hypothetical protein GF341_00475, partial [candidate division Zixibacteria bacterium]|nr:hypothetical protein [candidate division Zixibacteria bacterium]